jgi:hypothetical protein
MSDFRNELIQELIGDADSVLSCPLCGSPHEANGVQVLKQVAERYTLSIQRFCCGTGSLMTVRAPSGGKPVDESFANLITARHSRKGQGFSLGLSCGP